ncbi:MAG TPA: flagellar motor switch protein FliN [Acidimicrobiia bacterium]|nr:flagellar motor switch protein FliN [Acidimicrobiia bacterium]
MTLASYLAASTDVAFAFARALEEQLANDTVLTVGTARDSITAIVPDDAPRVVSFAFSSPEESGIVAIMAAAHFATSLEASASDELLITATGPALDAALQTLAAAAGIELDRSDVSAGDVSSLTNALAPCVATVYPILDGADAVACLIVGSGAPIDAAFASAGTASATSGSSRGGMSPTAFVLADVEMGVTAELGRCQMSVRELLSLTPGAVIDLDRAAGAPVDVLVNGTPIARGEVVVIDEEFGIRISELLTKPSA